MSRNSGSPGSRWLLYGLGLAGLFRTAEASLDEAGAPVGKIDPTIRAEPQDIHTKAVLLTGIGTLAGLWAIVLLLYPLFTYFKYDRTGGKQPSKVLEYMPRSPLPVGEADPRRELYDFRTREDAELNSYRWVDRSKGIVSIPIEQAIEIVAKRGIPPVQGGPQYYEPRAGGKQTGFEGKVEPLPR